MVILAILILAVMPSLLPTWRSTLIAACSVLVLIFAGLFWGLHEVETMTQGEGPAFAGILFLFVATIFFLFFSCGAKFAIASALYCLQPATAKVLRLTLAVAGLLVAVPVMYDFFAYGFRIQLINLIGLPFLWLSLVIWCMPKEDARF
ncbi:hypothetical protein RYB01_02375 [Pseudomonas syringae]|nr:hypothetical protein [Pseudomonas syringae]